MKKLVFSYFLFFISYFSLAQNVGIGISTPDPSAALDITSNTKGLLIPRLTTTQRNNIINPKKGLIAFDSTTTSVWYYTGTTWNELSGVVNKTDTITGNQSSPVNSYNMTNNTVVSNDTSGYLYDDGGPAANYSVYQDGNFNIYQDGTVIATRVVVFFNNLEPVNDSLTIQDDYHKYVLKGNTTGEYLLYGAVYIHFHSNATIVAAGFGLKWDMIYASSHNNYDPGQISGWYYNPAKLSMRGGTNAFNSWSPDSSGYYSFAYGLNNVVKGNYSVGIGRDLKVPYDFSTALGHSSAALSSSCFTLGFRDTARGLNSIAMCEGNNANGESSLAAGLNNTTEGLASIALGYNNKASGPTSFAAGNTNISSGNHSVAIGHLSNASNIYSVALGESCKSKNLFSMAIGSSAEAQGYSSVSMGLNTIAEGDFSMATGIYTVTRAENAYATGFHTMSKSYAGFTTGSYNDSVNAASMTGFNPLNRIFQIGNGTAEVARTNAMTVLQNGNVGIGEVNPGSLLHIKGTGGTNQLILENNSTNIISRFSNDGGAAGAYIGTTTNHDFSLVSNNSVRAIVTSGGAIDVKNNLTVQNGKGLIRNNDGTQSKKLSTTTTVNASFIAGETKTFAITWPESFSSSPEAFVGNITSGGGGWAEVVMTISGTTTSGATLYVYNPKTTTVNPNFIVKIIAIGPQ